MEPSAMSKGFLLLEEGFSKEGCAEKTKIYGVASHWSTGISQYFGEEIFYCMQPEAELADGEEDVWLKASVDEQEGCKVSIYKDEDCTKLVGPLEAPFSTGLGKCEKVDVDEDMDRESIESLMVAAPFQKFSCQQGPVPEGFFDTTCLTQAMIEDLEDMYEMEEDADEDGTNSSASCFSDCTLDDFYAEVDMRRLKKKGGLVWSTNEEAEENKKAFEAMFEEDNCASSCEDKQDRELLLAKMVAERQLDCQYRTFWHEGKSIAILL